MNRTKVVAGVFAALLIAGGVWAVTFQAIPVDSASHREVRQLTQANFDVVSNAFISVASTSAVAAEASARIGADAAFSNAFISVASTGRVGAIETTLGTAAQEAITYLDENSNVVTRTFLVVPAGP